MSREGGQPTARDAGGGLLTTGSYGDSWGSEVSSVVACVSHGALGPGGRSHRSSQEEHP
eukprot:CAMPEP_0179051232 /NCGR_PEP_ID=MMETSP0796-20121207/21141_1 /TAXON_ID=73915 /ORGANISM="Pyrodinium bahamense, Strain pbaha01" /LENGTH=58 /DNA_ID=CAMNT_0020747771 /DNA_START=320 /DNA_END=492 /DNA_ORIENTATION=+